MEKKTLTGYPRHEYKKRAAGRLRKEGKIPAVMYNSKGSISLAVDGHEFSKKFHTVSENTLIKLTVDKDSHDVLVKDYQEDIISGNILHIDFYEVEAGKLLRTNIPIHLIGSAKGAKEGGVLEQLMHEIEVECLPKDIPESLDVEVSDLGEGESVHVSELAPPAGVKLMVSGDGVVATITHVRGIEELEAEAAAEEGEEELEEGAAQEEEASEENEE